MHPELQPHLVDPARVCPVLASSAIIQNGSLTIRVEGQEHTVKGPPRFLRKLHDWCDGSRTLVELDALAAKAWGRNDFARFVSALLKAGILVDAAAYLLSAWDVAKHPSTWGHPVPRAVWPAIATQIPDSFEPGASELSFSAGTQLPRLSPLLQARESPSAFGPGAPTGEQLGALLWAVYGSCDSEGRRKHRVVASAGSFYALQVNLVLARDIEGLRAGVHGVEYSTQGRLALRQRSSDTTQLVRAFIQPERLRNAIGVIVLTADLTAASLKYRNRTLQYAFIEAGACLHSGALAAAEMDLGWRNMGGYDDIELARMCGLEKESVLACALFGAAPSAQERADEDRRKTVDFMWARSTEDMPFHVAGARIVTTGSAHKFSWGRAADPALAHRKALAEAVERHAYRQLGRSALAPATELGGWIDPTLFVHYSGQQYSKPDFPFRRFEETEKRRWVPVSEVTTGHERWVPAECVFHREALDDDDRSRLLTASTSSGCASHTDLAEAKARAAAEVIERDAFMRHWLSQRPGLSVSPMELPGSVQGRIRKLSERSCTLTVHVLDSSVMPVWFVAIQSPGHAFTAVGAGAGFDVDTALESALSEAEVAAWTRLSGAASKTLRPAEVRTPRDHADLYASARYYRRADALLGKGRTASYKDVTHAWPTDASALFERLHAAGRGALWADLTLADAPLTLDSSAIRTVRVMIPGAVPISFGHDRMPLGMLKADRKGLFPHPFP